MWPRRKPGRQCLSAEGQGEGGTGQEEPAAFRPRRLRLHSCTLLPPLTADSLAQQPRLPGAVRVTSPIHPARLPPSAGAGRAVALTTQTLAFTMTSSWSSFPLFPARSDARSLSHKAWEPWLGFFLSSFPAFFLFFLLYFLLLVFLLHVATF